MEERTRQELTRYGAPAAFLAAVTIAVILIKSGLSGGPGAVTTVGARPTTKQTTTQQTTTKLVLTTPVAPATTTSQATAAQTSTTQTSTTQTTTTQTTTPGGQYYTVQSGDTLGSIASQYKTTVAQLTTLNPGIDPNAMHIGQRVRVK
jgi:LysM repeat protein